MEITATVEFYDHHGLVLHSGFYAFERKFKAPSLKRAHEMVQSSLDVFGMVYHRAKTVTLRCDVPGKLFPVTLECTNPHFVQPKESNL